jgi:anhydro-N-acetylmuramic acid kinase
MQSLQSIYKKETRLAIGLMSGTCTDGIDAALVKIQGSKTNTSVSLLNFQTIAYDETLRQELLNISSGTYGGSYAISKANFLLGKLSADACLKVCQGAGISKDSIDFIASHGHTIYHQPIEENYFGTDIRSTLQIGEAAVISEIMNTIVLSDFRVRDMAAGGNGAPLVPYSEYLLYSEPNKAVALQNIGGIGNITYLPANGKMSDIHAFDTGPGNMIIDALVANHTNKEQLYDDQGHIAASGTINQRLLSWMLDDEYILRQPPKTTGRERYGSNYIQRLLVIAYQLNLSFPDILATATYFTAKTIEVNIRHFLPSLPEKLIVGGGGSYNLTLMKHLQSSLSNCQVLTNEDIGLNSSAKEAIAFAILGNETLSYQCNNVPTATGASHPVIMGKISM